MIAQEKVFSTSEPAYAVDRDGQISVWNKAAENVFGHAESEALGQQCWELLSGRDMFGNQSCCEGCPVRATAFNSEPIKRFQVDFKTASHERKRFTVRTLMLLSGPGEGLFVHLCHSDTDETKDKLTKQADIKRDAYFGKRRALTPRETQVLSLLHKGTTIPKVASTLGISTSTVRNHTQNILLKLQVHSRFEAVALARKLGYI